LYNELYSDNLVLQQRDFDLKVQLTDYIIPIIERPSMNAGLEVRSPFLSKDLIEYISNIDYRILFMGRQKDVLRRLVERYIPPDLVNHPKRGFSVPVDALIANTQHKYNYKLDFEHVPIIWKDDKRWGKFLSRLLIKEYYFNKNHH
jgi:asparagine synthetase B (glutamine-hydrolysing)